MPPGHHRLSESAPRSTCIIPSTLTGTPGAGIRCPHFTDEKMRLGEVCGCLGSRLRCSLSGLSVPLCSQVLSVSAPPPPEPGGQGGRGVVRQGLLLPNPGQIQSSTLAGGRQAPNSSGKGWQTARRGRDRQKIRLKKIKRCPCVLPKFSGCKFCSHWLLYSASWWRCEDAGISYVRRPRESRLSWLCVQV